MSELKRSSRVLANSETKASSSPRRPQPSDRLAARGTSDQPSAAHISIQGGQIRANSHQNLAEQKRLKGETHRRLKKQLLTEIQSNQKEQQELKKLINKKVKEKKSANPNRNMDIPKPHENMEI